MNFSYSTTGQRVRHSLRRQPDPFGPKNSSFSRLGSKSLDRNSASGEPIKAPAPPVNVDSEQTYPAPQEPVTNIVDSDPLRRSRSAILKPLSPVVHHPAPVAWDDDPHLDLPYDNPYYTQAIDNVLWLPRDPFGILDLDDTVDLRVALTSDLQAPALGTWVVPGETSSPESIHAKSSTTTQPGIPQRQYTGSEEIVLPPAIAKRVRELEEDDDVEDTIQQRPPMFGRRNPSSDRRSSIIGGPPSPQLGFRSFSAGAGSRTRSASVLSVLEPPRVDRSASSDQPSGTRPDAHAQADFVRSTLPAAHMLASQLSVISSPLSRVQKVTTHDAVVTEVAAQEASALAERLEEEWAESGKDQSKSWLTAWMFKKRE